MRTPSPWLFILCLPLVACDEPGGSWRPFDASGRIDTGIADGSCWPSYGEASCEALGWTWYPDFATSYCRTPPCGPRTEYPFCALPCTEDADCAGTTVPHCDGIGYWGGSDNYGCSSFRVCVPADRGPFDCYRPHDSELCSR